MDLLIPTVFIGKTNFNLSKYFRLKILFPIFTETEFLGIAKKLKPHVERRMKIEPFPWLRDYYVDMSKLYTELILDKIENELLGEKRRTLQGYQEMFDSIGRDKILIKGNPGIGKTTLGKKVGWDWAKGVFNMFSMVFFIFLKFVNPGETIENIILKQNPELEGLGVSAEKLRGILSRFSGRCLLILDGLDEHGLRKNEDVLRIIKNQKYIDCGIIVSSRPHITREIQINFSTVVGVNGFTREQAYKFVSNFFTEESKIKQIMEFEPSDSDLVLSSIQQCPILLSFFCFLVAEQEIDLSDKKISDIYIRLVKCLYKKFTIRKGVEFEKKGLFFIYKSVGKLALQTLISNNPLLQRREVLSLVGDFAFDYGLFAGHEDIRLLGDPAADIYVTYPHRSLEEFFGSIGFIQALCGGKTIDEILGSDCEKPIFMVNLLVLRFRLWLLSSSNFNFSQKDECYDKLTSYSAKRIDSKVFHPYEVEDVYPAIDMVYRLAFSVQFIHDVLDKCKHITTLHLDNGNLHLDVDDVDNFFSLMNRDFIDRLTTIIINHDHFKLKEADNNSLIVSILCYDSEALQMTNLLLQKYNLSERNPQIYTLIINAGYAEDYDITFALSIPSHELHIVNDFVYDLLVAPGEFPHCPILTHLTIVDYHIDESVPSELRKAIRSGKLPCLRRITLKRCVPSSRLEWPDEGEVSVTNEGSKYECEKCKNKSEDEHD